MGVKMKKTLAIISIFLTAVIFSSCRKSSAYNFSMSKVVNLLEAGEDAEELKLPTQCWHKSNDCVVVVFGYGYNDEEFVTSMKEKLFETYGDYQNNGRLLPLVFPDDFKHGSRTYITDLASILQDKQVSGMVILGAPEGTHKAIARLQDAHDGILPYPVISFFSQDEILGMEDSADFIIDKAQKAEINGIVSNETTADYVKEVPVYLENALRYADISEGAFTKDAKLFDVVKMITGKKTKLSRYSDSETGLISINHFVIE